MPELPDIMVYIEALESRVLYQRLEKVRLASPFLLRTAVPPIKSAEGRKVVSLRRLGKRIVFGLEGDLWLVLHLMIAGRLQWKPPGAALQGKVGLAAFDFAHSDGSGGSLTLTEAGSKKRASLHLLEGAEALATLDPGGLEVLEADLAAFTTALTARNHTVKRALTDPRIFSGIGNAYSDEILHRAGLSPVVMTSKLGAADIERLHAAVCATLDDWTRRLRDEAGADFPKKVTAFRKEMAVHGRYGQPCPVCGTKVQRIRHASNETNYCPRCQTGGKLLADRSLSALLKKDWPRSIEELEQPRGKG
ncbi:formamidopyrimidine-DNA glycosylase [Pelagibius litoralis]|uniref:Formamidopyrimidine-DNA glycosylase n=1 Tax=Pelagibius litoralis TaxID=374515 RepID=A0A967CBU7_9PROT|nr:DNA-formamidopyrimidine glycosylase family protein [Pelagibius litoralis]NIA68489.1 formamidopyrimidine-DNA glycosylase [Pelagibius litoralis]